MVETMVKKSCTQQAVWQNGGFGAFFRSESA